MRCPPSLSPSSTPPLTPVSPHRAGYTGAATERGAPGTAAEGTNVNVPLPLGTGDEAYVAALEGAVQRIKEWEPEVLVVSCVPSPAPSSSRSSLVVAQLTRPCPPARSLGVDTFIDDPLTEFQLSLGAYPRIGALVARVGVRTLFVMEGASPSLSLLSRRTGAGRASRG